MVGAQTRKACVGGRGRSWGLSPAGARASLGSGCPATRPPAGPVGALSKASSKARAIGSGCEPSAGQAGASPPRHQNWLSWATLMKPGERKVGTEALRNILGHQSRPTEDRLTQDTGGTAPIPSPIPRGIAGDTAEPSGTASRMRETQSQEPLGCCRKHGAVLRSP